jgi:hypothetical protein
MSLPDDATLIFTDLMTNGYLPLIYLFPIQDKRYEINHNLILLTRLRLISTWRLFILKAWGIKSMFPSDAKLQFDDLSIIGFQNILSTVISIEPFIIFFRRLFRWKNVFCGGFIFSDESFFTLTLKSLSQLCDICFI